MAHNVGSSFFILITKRNFKIYFVGTLHTQRYIAPSTRKFIHAIYSKNKSAFFTFSTRKKNMFKFETNQDDMLERDHILALNTVQKSQQFENTGHDIREVTRLNSIGLTCRKQVAYWFSLDKCTLLSIVNILLPHPQLAQYYQVPVAI